MTDLVQKLAPQILEEIKKAKNILLHCHPSPDPDSVGGALAMMHVLEEMGKKVTVIRGDSAVPLSFSGLPGFNKFLHKNFFEVDLTRFDFFLIQDAGSLGQISRINPVVFPKGLRTVSIDHHATNDNYSDINLVDPTYPATCQILYDLFVSWGVTITTEIAKCLMLGMYTDTGGFKFPTMTSETFSAAAHLSKIAPDYTSTISFMDDSNTPGVIAFEALALSSVTLHCNNHVAISAVSYDALQKKGVGKEEIFPDIGSILKSVIGWEIGIKMIEDKTRGVHVSFRTRNEKVRDVGKIAVALGGGGHDASAGAYLKNVSIEEAVKKVVDAINSIYPELSK
jgi:bifunctional oligoribonuclease and PAP phosphatase NrnA